ncbi:MAG: ECF-type sigma factor [Planctomycetota bacterium]
MAEGTEDRQPQDGPPELSADVYQTLRRIAERFMRGERDDHTLQATALVHEAFLRSAASDGDDSGDRRRFIAAAARAMRHVLVDHARKHNALKRGNDRRVLLDPEVLAGDAEDPLDLLELDEALARLGDLHERQARIVECRFFGGLTIEETAQVLAISHRTVERDWKVARAWLRRELGRTDER